MESGYTGNTQAINETAGSNKSQFCKEEVSKSINMEDDDWALKTYKDQKEDLISQQKIHERNERLRRKRLQEIIKKQNTPLFINKSYQPKDVDFTMLDETSNCDYEEELAESFLNFDKKAMDIFKESFDLLGYYKEQISFADEIHNNPDIKAIMMYLKQLKSITNIPDEEKRKILGQIQAACEWIPQKRDYVAKEKEKSV